MTKLRWGILGTSNFARNKILPAFQKSEYAEVVAIASRDLRRAEAVAAEFGVPKAYGDYDALLSDKNVDVIYNPLPNHLHVAWTSKALDAGKHVLCEKPVALSAAEAQQLVAAASRYPRLKVMEAFMYRFHPQWQHTKKVVSEGGIGELRTIQSFFSYFNKDARNIRNQKASGGGGLLDIGCYNISLSRFIFCGEPQRVFATVQYDPEFQVDWLASGMLVFPRGVATFTCSTQLAWYQRVNILGTTGRIEIELPFNARPDQPARLWHQRNGDVEEVQFPLCNQYTIELDRFSQSILDDGPTPTPLADAVNNMKVIDAVVESGRKNRWISIE
jgi:predicted dehydrogenase